MTGLGRAVAAPGALPQRVVPSAGNAIVRLDIASDRGARATLIIRHVWRVTGAGLTSLYRVVSPGRLQGTLTRVVESGQPHSFTVTTRARGARRPGAVLRSPADENVLGSDFVYGDLLMLAPDMPSPECSLRPTQQGGADVCGAMVWRSAKCTVETTVSPDGLVEAGRWTSPDGSSVYRRFSVTDTLRQRELVFPAKMLAERPVEGFCSALTLLRLRIEPFALSLTRRPLASGWVLEPVR